VIKFVCYSYASLGYHSLIFCFCDVMVSVLDFIVVDLVRSTQFTNEMCICCLFTKHAAFRNKDMLTYFQVQGLTNPLARRPGLVISTFWASWNNQLYVRLASKKIYWILTNLSIFAYLLIFIYVIFCLISSNVLFIQALAFCRNWEQRR
jgi:hypothetical protein